MTGQGGGNPSEQFLTAHELGHQWWGDSVTCANWQDIWLNEGFATYTEAIWREFRPPGIGPIGLEGLQGLMAARRPGNVNGSVYCFDISSESRIFSTSFSYNKGAWVLHMLRHVMGDEAFFQALRDHRAANLYSTATTAQFQAVCEAVHGSSLDWFFQPWVYQIGAPTYQYAGRTVTVNGRAFLEVFLEQVQSSTWPTFTMPLDVRATIGGTPVTVVARNDARREHLLLPVPAGALTGIELDPDLWVLTVASSTSTSVTGSKTEVAFPEGPPKVTETVPAPSSHAAPGTLTEARVWFHKPMTVSSLTAAGRVTLSGARQGAIPRDGVGNRRRAAGGGDGDGRRARAGRLHADGLATGDGGRRRPAAWTVRLSAGRCRAVTGYPAAMRWCRSPLTGAGSRMLVRRAA